VTEHPLALGAADHDRLAAAATRFVAGYLAGLPTEPTRTEAPAGAARRLLAAPPDRPGDLGRLLATVAEAGSYGLNTASAGYLAYFPAGGLPSAAWGELIALVLNRYTTFGALAPGLVALEESVLRWLCGVFGLPPGAGGLVLSGGSMATLAAVVAAREQRLGDDPRQGVIYVGEYTHHCVDRAARIAGLAGRLRVVPSTPDLRMDPAAAARQVTADRGAGLRPFLLVGTAGATSTGLVDPLPALAAVAAREDLWFHVDGAYGAPFQLTGRGRDRLAGIERADSIALDPHKSMFLPYGTGVLLVRDPGTLRAAHAAGGDYLQDIDVADGLPDYAALGPELTREYRGLRLWLPLHLHGTDAFRQALDEKLDLARWIHGELATIPRLELPWTPDLTVVGLRPRDPSGDPAGRDLLDRINASGRVFLSSVRVAGRYTLRLCPQSFRSHQEHASEAVRTIRAALR
jgi:aromatic-L-amino-acid decarboxylase